MRAISKRLGRLEGLFWATNQTESSRRLRARLEAGDGVLPRTRGEPVPVRRWELADAQPGLQTIFEITVGVSMRSGIK
jgi:hypothetical protein